MSKGFTDWSNEGVWSLQDHDIGDDVDPGMRQQMVGGRISFFPNAKKSTDPEKSVIEYGLEDDLGTLGDVHPWYFWQTADKEERASGSFAQCFAGLAVEGSGGPPPGRTGQPAKATGFLPMRTGDHGADGRYKAKFPGQPKCASRVPQGAEMLILAGTEESTQHELMLHTDSRIIAVNAVGPGDAGTLVCDLQPGSEICMDGSTEPGKGGRHARIQSMMRVIAIKGGINLLGTGDGNSVAWNLTASGVDNLAGFGLCFAKLDGGGRGSGPTTPRKTGPLTPPRDPRGRPITQPPGAPGGGGNPGSKGPIRDLRPKGSSGAGGGGGPISSFGGGEGAGNGGPPGGTATAKGKHDKDGDTPCSFGQFGVARKGGHGCLTMAQVGASGPITAGAEGDKHTIGRDRDGHTINAGHIDINAYHYENLVKDGPQLFEGFFPIVEHMPIRTYVHQEFDLSLSHPFIGGAKQGKWRWWAETNVVSPKKKKKIPRKLPPRTKRPTGPKTPSGPGPTTPTGPKPPGPGNPPGGGPNTGGPVGRPITGGPRAPGPIPPIDPKANAPFKPRRKGPITPRRNQFGGDSSLLDPPPLLIPDDLGQGGIDDDTGLGGLEPGHDRGASTIGEVGEVDSRDHSLFSLMHPMGEGFAEIYFRPQLMVLGGTSFTHNPDLDGDEYNLDEETRPQVLAARAFGGVDAGAGDWDYVEDVDTARARGGTAHGGLVFTPPKFELEDYFGLGSTATVTDISTISFVCCAPNVAFALGTPKANGGLNNSSVVIGQDITDLTHNPFRIAQYDNAGTLQNLLTGRVFQSGGSADEIHIVAGGTAAMQVPAGTDAQRPATPTAGDIRLSTTATANFEGYDGSSWLDLSAAGGGGSWKTLSDTVGAFGASGTFVFNNAGTLDFVDHTGAADPHSAAYTTTADLASVVNAKGASLIGIEDATAIFTGTDVEAALTELHGLFPPAPETMLLDGSQAMTGDMDMGGFCFTTEDAGTDTVLYPACLKRTTSGTPAAGIGTGLEFITETSAGNNEIGAVIEAVTTDVTATSEDFDLVFKTMAAGGAVAARFRWDTSAGGLVIGANAAGGIFHVESSVGTSFKITDANSNVLINPDGVGNCVFGTVVDNSARFQVVGGAFTQFELRDNSGATQRKFATIGGTHYTFTEQPLGLMFTDVGSSWANMFIGGGDAAFNAVKTMRLHAAANNTTTTGTVMAWLDINGVMVASGATAPSDLFHVSTTGDANAQRIDKATGYTAFGNAAPAAKVHVTIGGGDLVPCVELEQNDNGTPFIEYDATSAATAGNSVSSWTAGNTIQGFIRVSINGTDRWMPFYDAPTS